MISPEPAIATSLRQPEVSAAIVLLAALLRLSGRRASNDNAASCVDEDCLRQFHRSTAIEGYSTVGNKVR